MGQYNPGQIKKFLKQLRQREEQYLYYLGRLAYGAGERGLLSDPAMLDAYRTLRDIKAQIGQWEASLAELKAAKEATQRPRCPNCGGGVVKGAPYCPSCGGALAAPRAPTPASPAGTAPSSPIAPPYSMPGPGAAATMPSYMPGAGAPVPPTAAVSPPVFPYVQAGAPAATQAAPPTPYATAQPGAQTAPAAPRAQDARSCPQCGESLGEDSVFCGNCGARVSSDTEAPADSTPEPGTDVTKKEAVEAEEVLDTAKGLAEDAPGEGGVAAAEAVTAEGPASPEAQGAEGEAAASEELSADETIACPSCWTSIADPEARFCPNCGEKVRE